MKTNKGFTLTEVLLGLMIVGIIGISLAALTTSASRDSGSTSSKMMLRNNLSLFLRQLRQDIREATQASQLPGVLATNNDITLLKLKKHTMLDGTSTGGGTQSTVMYCYIKATNCTGIQPAGACIGGQIKRIEVTDTTDLNRCKNNGKVVLNNVKYINSADGNYPLFQRVGGSDLNTLLRVKLILELPSTPVINDAVEDVFVLPNGF